MKKLLSFVFCIIQSISRSLAVAEDFSSSNPQIMMEHFLRQEAVRLDAAFLQGITNRQQWEARRPQLHREYLEMLGLWPMPEKTPLKTEVTGILERDEGFRVEKVHFQSRPRLYVTGNLYLPADARAGSKLPAVLYVCGHSPRGRDGNKTAYQHHGIWFATHGYACLMIDTLQLGEIAAIHHGTYRENRWWWQARGYTSAAVECWNGIRALDYLQSRPEVDGERIGVTGISGGGAGTFWIAAADERVKVAVPVSGMGDLEDYVGKKVVNGHCDCMFLINTFQWPWTQIAALVAPRPMLFENSGHDTIFPMNGNDRIRARLENLYSFYTNRTDRLFDIGVAPGGHEDKPELRLMAYRWINRFLKGDDKPVTEPDPPKIEGPLLRAFPDRLPADELNTRIDELFVPTAGSAKVGNALEFASWRRQTVTELKRIVFRSVGEPSSKQAQLRINGSTEERGAIQSEPGIWLQWKYFPAKSGSRDKLGWLVVANAEDSLETKPEWLGKIIGNSAMVLIAPRGNASMKDPAPYYIHRSLPLLGRTMDTCKVQDVVAAIRAVVTSSKDRKWNLAGHGPVGVIGAYAAVLEPGLNGVLLSDPPISHKDEPIFPNILRLVDLPEGLALLAPLELTIRTSQSGAFERTAELFRAAGAKLNFGLLP